MFYRLVLSVFLVFCVSASIAATSASKEQQKLAQTVFELERNVALLQMSTLSLEDYEAIDEKMAQVPSLEFRVNFLGNLTFLLCMALVVFFFQLRKQNKRLAELEKNKGTNG